MEAFGHDLLFMVPDVAPCEYDKSKRFGWKCVKSILWPFEHPFRQPPKTGLQDTQLELEKLCGFCQEDHKHTTNSCRIYGAYTIWE